MGSWTTWFLDFNKRGAWNKRGGATFGSFLINVMAEITELWVENSQEINCRDVTSIREGRVNFFRGWEPDFKSYKECHDISEFFNRDLNRGCLVYMFSLRFSGRKYLINLRRQFRVRKIFVYVKFFVHMFLWDLQSFHFVFKIILSKMGNLCSRLLFY